MKDEGMTFHDAKVVGELLFAWVVIGVIVRVIVGIAIPNFITPSLLTIALSILLWPMTCWAATIPLLAVPPALLWLAFAWWVLR